MPVRVEDKGFVETSAKEFPVLAVNVLDRLGYQVTRASKQLDQILATQRLDEQIGQDWWRHEYRVILRWRNAKTSGVVVNIEIEENKGGASQAECQKRCDRILLELQNDAVRAEEAKEHKEKNTVYGAATWGSEEDLRALDYFQKNADPKRLIIGRSSKNEYIQVPERLTHAHALVCGRTGVGKSRGFFIPQLVERVATNMIVTEATPGNEAGELYQLTSGWRKMAGHKVYCFNPSDMSSTRINPIDRVRNAPEEKKSSMAESLADLVIMNGESGDNKVDKTWSRSEKHLLTSLILHAAIIDPERGHFGALRWMLLEGPDKLAKILYNSPSEIAQMEFEGWMQLAGKTNFAYGVFSGLISKMNPWMTDQIVTLTEKTDIDLEALKQQLFTFYIAVPSRSTDSKLIGSLMFNFLLDHILDIRKDMKYPMTMLLDEFTNFGKIPGIENALSLIRKNKIGLILGFQNYSQLEQIYTKREAQTIMDMPATQVHFKQKTFQEARDLSEAIGRMTVDEATVSDSGRVQESIQGRHLITPDELISLNKEVIIFTADTRPLKMPLISPDAYNQAMEYDPPVRAEHKVSEFVRKRGRVAKEKPAPVLDKTTEPVRQPETRAEHVENQEVETADTRTEPISTPEIIENEAKKIERDKPTEPEKENDSDNRRPIPNRQDSPDWDV